MAYPLARLCVAALLGAVLVNAQVVFSRRSYTERGRTWHQLWMWNQEDGKMKPLTHSSRNHFAPSCAVGRGLIYFYTGDESDYDRQIWAFNRATGAEHPAIAKPAAKEEQKVPIVGCENSAWTTDRTRGACAVGQNVLFYDAAQGTITGRVRFDQRPTPPDVLGWSANGEWLLVSTMGAKDNSTSRQSDFFLLSAADRQWKFAGSGNSAFWVPGRNELIYSSPRDLTPLGKGKRHGVWTAQLEIFDPATGKHTSITKGKTYNIQPAPCVK